MATEKIVDLRQEQNKEVVRRLIEEGFGQGNLAAVDELVAPDLMEHQAGMPQGREGLRKVIVGLRGILPDLHYTIEDITASGDRVWIRLRGYGTHRGEFMGLLPTGKAVVIDVIDICRLEDGKVVEHWGVPDRFSMLEQLGILQRLQRPTT